MSHVTHNPTGYSLGRISGTAPPIPPEILPQSSSLLWLRFEGGNSPVSDASELLEFIF